MGSLLWKAASRRRGIPKEDMCTSGDIAREVTLAKPGAWELPSQARYGVGFSVFPCWISVLLWFAHFSHSVHTLFLFLE